MSIVLIIDPDPNSHASWESLCGWRGAETIVTGNLLDGFSLYKQLSVDLIIVNLFLPQKSGFSFIAEITSKESHPPIIATFSADRAPKFNIKRFAHLLGASYAFEKPLNPGLFLQACSELVTHFPTKQDRG